MSTLTVHQMLQEAIGPITERFKYLRERRNLDKKAGYTIVYDPSFNFVGSDGYLLGVKIFHSTDSESGVVDEVDTIADEQFYTVITKSGNLKNYPCLTTGKGDLIFVHDPSVSGAETVFQGYRRLADTQKWTQGARVVSDRAPEHVPRPMNAFIIYRNAQMANVRRQNPGIGNNDVSRIIGRNWRALDPESRAHFKGLAARSAQEHQAKHPGYKYTPRKSDDVVRRRKRYGGTEQPFRDPRIHHNADSIGPPTRSLHELIPGFPDLDSLTKTWVEEPTATHFDALMSGFDCALGLAENPP